MRRTIGLTLVLLSLLAGMLLFAQQRTKRLILKDGSYQAVSKYEVKGERVRYYSAERYAWEDLPSSLVDWDATNMYNENPVANAVTSDPEAEAEEAAEQARDEAASPTVAPGLRLPDVGGVILLDQYNGKPELNELLQNGADIKKNTGKNVLRSVVNPLASAKQSFELEGAHARVQAHVPRPVLYVNLGADATTSPISLVEHYRIMRVQQKEKSRVIGNLNIKFYGKVSQSQQKFVPARAEKVNAGPWIRITPEQDLEPGEYAVVEMLEEKEMNLFVWDFGVNPKAPANAASWKPVAVRAPSSQPADPALEKRP